MNLSTDFFDLGFVPHQVIAQVRHVINFHKEVRPEVTLIGSEIYYAHPSTEKLASMLENSGNVNEAALENLD